MDSAFTFWQAKTSEWPILALFALNVVSLPASQVSTERVFSVWENFTKGKRNRTKTTLEWAVFLWTNGKKYLMWYDSLHFHYLMWTYCATGLMVLFSVMSTSGLLMLLELTHGALCFWVVLKMTLSYYSSSYKHLIYILVCTWCNTLKSVSINSCDIWNKTTTKICTTYFR